MNTRSQRLRKTPAKRMPVASKMTLRKSASKKQSRPITRKTKKLAKSVEEHDGPCRKKPRRETSAAETSKKGKPEQTSNDTNPESVGTPVDISARIAVKKKEKPVDNLASSGLMASVSAKLQPDASLTADSSSDDDEEFPSLHDLLSKSAVSSKFRFKKGDVIMAKVGRHPRWPYIVSSVKKNGRATLLVLPREFPIPKGTQPEYSVAVKKLERYRKDMCDLVGNYHSKYAADFIIATKQAEAILDGQLNPFADNVAIEEDMVEDHAAVASNGGICGSSVESGNATSKYIEVSEDEEESNNVQDKPKAKEEDFLSPEERERTELLVRAILSNQTEDYLVKIMRKQVRSQYRTRFYTLEKMGRLAFRYKGCFPLQEEEHISPVFEHVINVRRIHEPNLCGRNGDSYAQSVLMPEAIKFGLRTVWKLTEIEAERIMSVPPYYFFEMALEKNEDGTVIL